RLVRREVGGREVNLLLALRRDGGCGCRHVERPPRQVAEEGVEGRLHELDLEAETPTDVVRHVDVEALVVRRPAELEHCVRDVRADREYALRLGPERAGRRRGRPLFFSTTAPGGEERRGKRRSQSDRRASVELLQSPSF